MGVLRSGFRTFDTFAFKFEISISTVCELGKLGIIASYHVLLTAFVAPSRPAAPGPLREAVSLAISIASSSDSVHVSINHSFSVNNPSPVCDLDFSGARALDL